MELDSPEDIIAKTNPLSTPQDSLQEHRQKFRQILMKAYKTPEEQEYYNYLLVKALGADSIEEAVHIVKAAGIHPEDLPELLVD